eukprot:gb/GECH01013486.1/.p1 GENE.gb/GECH01013486.1/~~gb/GECH01013486.1/.p1  ORF type:complete len:363 (+),score=80.15 gb/GECH01013486.1/:1-1089(+)
MLRPLCFRSSTANNSLHNHKHTFLSSSSNVTHSRLTRRSIFGFGKSRQNKETSEKQQQQKQEEKVQQQQQQHQQQKQHSHQSGTGFHRNPTKISLPGIQNILAISSAKGGVGKSTTAVNTALSLSLSGRRVGILDADVYGPSLPRMMNLDDGKMSEVTESKLILPKNNFGVKCMSMGFLMGDDLPAMWRGPMVMSAVEQMLKNVFWDELDYLIIDLPPGTGDAQITISQRVPLTGAVVVSTPQDIALIDARRGANMFKSLEVPVVGVVENMSYFACPNCGHKEHIFGDRGAEKTAEDMGLNFLGGIPLHVKIRETSDSGSPIAISDQKSEHALAYMDIAKKIMSRVESQELQQEAPNIVVED